MSAWGEIEGIAIAGATASGKSAFALRLAKKYSGIIINADSAQVYADLCILTARPSKTDEDQAPHALFGHVDGAVAFSAAGWAGEAMGIIKKEKRLPILVGGTGLYFRALFAGLVKLPAIPAEVRRKWREQTQRSTPELHAELATRDPETAAQLMVNDRQRILRALEVFETTGRSLVSLQKEATQPLLNEKKWRRFVIVGDRATLAERIANRFQMMLRAGALEEVKALAARNLSLELPIMKAIGVSELTAHLNGALTIEEAAAQAISATQRYAKRQETWFNNQMADWQRLSFAEAELL